MILKHPIGTSTNFNKSPTNRPSSSRSLNPTSSYLNSPRSNQMPNFLRDESFQYAGEKMRQMKSKIGNNISINSRNGVNENNLYPTELVFLLSNEEGNVQHMKRLVEEEKKRVNRDFENFSRQIKHIIEDLRLSVHSKLDFIFRDFIRMYQSVKDKVTQMRQIRQRILQNGANQGFEIKSPRSQVYADNVSNLNILQQISRDQDYFKTHRVYEEITSAYFEAIGPIMMETQDILTIGSQVQFYKDHKCTDILNSIRDSFYGSTKTVYEVELDNLVIQVQDIIDDNNMLLKGLSIDEPKFQRNSDHNKFEKQKQSISTIQNYNSNGNGHTMGNQNKKRQEETEQNPYGFELPAFKNNFDDEQERPRTVRPSSSSDHMRYRSRPESQWSRGKKQFQLDKQKYVINTNAPTRGRSLKVSRDQQNLIVDWAQSINLKRASITFSGSNAQDILLCTLFANNGKNLVVGSKDRNIYIYSTSDGRLLQTLSGHRASVCSLSSFGNFFASGGDNGCGSLILWESATWKMKRKINLHTAALTCIVDCLDGCHLATGGYDKKIHIYNYKKSETSFEVNSCRSGVTSMIICEQSRKLISAGLDSTLTIWNIFTQNGELQTISLERIITNCGLVCSLRPLTLVSDTFLVGNKQGKIMLINMHSGEIVKTLFAGKGSVIEMAVIQRQNKSQFPIILSCCNGEKEMMLIKCDTGLSDYTKVRTGIGFGCGIGPKLVFDEVGNVAIVSQSPNEKQVAVYKIEVN